MRAMAMMVSPERARLGCALFALVLAAMGVLQAQVPILPLAEIEPGMQGEWHTVVRGHEVESFRLKVLGIARNFIGPRRDVIICEALDADQILNGPVAGMSGSPVYIDGKLVGAYAYGYQFSKEQAIIGVQPIESMLEVLDYTDGKKSRAAAATSDWKLWRGALPDGAVALGRGLEPLPVAAMACGFSAGTLEAFRAEAERLGLRFEAAPSGGGVSEETYDLEPGMPVAAVMMSGDFSVAGTGTVTWKEGNRLLAFGHPFFQWGTIEVPMAGAEIITVVRSVVSSFKLSNTGKVVGSIYQDRQTAIAGEVGRMAPTTALSVELESPYEAVRHYEAQVMRDYAFTPLMLSMALNECVQDTLAAEREHSVRIEAAFEVTGYGTLTWEAVAGTDATELIKGLYEQLLAVMDNPFEVPQIESVRFHLVLKDHWAAYWLRSASLLGSSEVKPGVHLRVRYALEHWRGEAVERVAEFDLPEDLAPGDYELVLADAAYVNELRVGAVREDFDGVEDYLKAFDALVPNDQLYLVLVRHAEGLRVRGHTLYDLPASVRALMGSELTETVSTLPLLEKAIPVEGSFRGVQSFSLNVIP